jgi:hypothetical protein
MELTTNTQLALTLISATISLGMVILMIGVYFQKLMERIL